ncbi:chromate efflux transporter [Mesorhizobium ciceri]|uniref:Chromate transporter, chromate ion transporter (CHR) family n=1 Tax=Mesorhizobium ciceri biovar biserrulae (strain HAMBI 2942 / LMG 23838 / WSM1271) TaxID=765698 RepID=E8T729_MESCW|nr:MULTISPECIES: chromate efflux transporter [Mesorhizobium]RUZ89723.1 chromate efflux transporter [Mesorhizobium sp. M7A.F.Ca.US.003.02.2.1]ADV09303.1 chromate transporter, chromate ion transporter (CHR) family [Mesorhizobium ciceri biovar biserrulae WSM1271]AMX98575.1 chromate transporter [Mesorhizobium ciceri biovar biserrulae]RUX76017.1 chromate efflux transporter [Mesorhizobium sp. M7A.F.Ca.US.005.03.1.1]RUY18529.1 chromate efflux transporter [Mesorhizobium sp. M7A.F.Ca.US.005.03.2.1]
MTALVPDNKAGTVPVPAAPTFTEAVKVWAKIGLLSFGGPAGQIALMHKELVEERRWIGERRFLHALNYCMLLPGPEAQQLAIYIGWLLHRTAGGLVAGILFVLPGALVMLALSSLYVLYGDVPLVAALFFGVKAAVLAIVVEAVVRISRRALKNRVMVSIAVAAFIAIYALNVPFPLIVLLAGLTGWLGDRIAPALFSGSAHGKDDVADFKGAVDLMFERGELAHVKPTRWHAPRTVAIWLPLWLGPVLLIWWFTGSASVWTEIGRFFSLMAVVTFGGAYAVLAYVAQAAVQSFGWLAPGEMVDGLGLAETTPGPLILVLQFVGFIAAFRHSGSLDPLVAGSLGALLTLWVTFTPCFFWIFLGAPYIEALRGNKALSAALGAITAAVVGVIMNLALWFALHVIFREVHATGLGMNVPVPSSIDWRAALLSVAAMVAILKLKVGMLPTLALSALAGILLAAAG